MGKVVLNDASITVNSVDLSDHANQVEITSEKDTQEVTSFGATNKEYALGLGDATIQVTFFQDFAASSVDATLYDVHTGGEAVEIVVKPTSDAVSETNPSYTMQAILPSYTPLTGNVGDASTIQATFQNADQSGLVRATT